MNAPTTLNTVSIEQVSQFLYQEARFLDDEQWDDWLACYAPSASFWMPAWDDDDTLTTDPQSEISLIYYPDRQGLEDRVFRIRTGKAASASPLPRTFHSINNVQVHTREDGLVEAKVTWHTLYNRQGLEGAFYGHATYLLRPTEQSFKIRRQHSILLNDKIDSVLDFYHV